MIRLIDIRHTATTPLPVDVANNTTIQDALHRLRKLLNRVDNSGLCREVDAAPEHLSKARSNLLSLIKEARIKAQPD